MPGPVPFRYWQEIERRRDYVLWLGHRLGFRRMEDYYRIKTDDFKYNYGAGVAVTYWRSSTVDAVREAFPQYEWHDWLFNMVPKHIWRDMKTRRKYMKWLGGQLGYQRANDWYDIRIEDFKEHKGQSLLSRYHRSPALAVVNLVPNREWHEWKFRRVPYGFWEDPANRQRYVKWLGKRLRIRRLDDWFQVGKEDFQENYGGTLMLMYGSHTEVLRECVPELNDLPQEIGKRRSQGWRAPLNIVQILKWADQYYKQHGDWPKQMSGLVSGTAETWSAVDQALPKGRRGLPGGSSLSLLLAQHRGVHYQHLSPKLSEEEILTWADEFFEQHGTWPRIGSGEIPGTEESWHKINNALQRGRRGLAGGSSLYKLLKAKRGVPNPHDRPRLSERKILTWMRRYYRKHKRWPTCSSVEVPGEPNEGWSALDMALRAGCRGLKGGSSLARLRRKHGLT
jgi:hypothetical protein